MGRVAEVLNDWLTRDVLLERAAELALDDVASPLGVVAVDGVEAVGEAFRFEVGVVSADPLSAVSLLGRGARLRLNLGRGAPRVVHGVVLRHRLVGAHRLGLRYRHRFTLGPRFSLLEYRINSRIFQSKTVAEIIASVLAPAGVRVAWRADLKLPTLEYCVQYRERDDAFVERLLREAGYAYWFEHDPDAPRDEGETLVVADDPLTLSAVASGPLVFQRDADEEGDAAGDLQRLEAQEQLVSNRLTQWGYDFLEPMVPYSNSQRADEVSPAWAPFATPVELERYSHHDDYLRSEVSTRSARIALMQEVSQRAVFEGASARQDLAPGRRFVLIDHPATALNRGYAVWRVAHTLRDPTLEGEPNAGLQASYTNQLTLGPAEVLWRGAPAARSLQQVTETATVVGPADEGIYTDAHGRIKVQFHWDREGRRDADSSCWIRVMQGWAGQGYGAQFIPRVGAEVVVAFLEGDTDRPMIVGSLYNGTQGPPFTLPVDATRSGFRSAVDPWGQRYHELSFEDHPIAPELKIRAEGRLNLEVIGHAQERVHGDSDTRIDGHATHRTAFDLSASVGGASQSRVGGARHIETGGEVVEFANQSVTRKITRDLDETLGGARRVSVAGRDVLEIASDSQTTVRGHQSTVVGHPEAPRTVTTHVEGTLTSASSGVLSLVSQEAIELRCGTSVLRIGPTQIEVIADTVMLKGKGSQLQLALDDVTLQMAQNLKVLGKALTFKSEGGALRLDRNATLDGQQIDLKNTVSEADKMVDESPKLTRIELRDQHGTALGLRAFRIEYPDGRQETGVLDAAGVAERMVEPGAEIVFLDGFEVEEG